MIVRSDSICADFTNTIMTTRLKNVVKLSIFVAYDAFTNIIVSLINIVNYLLNIDLILRIFTCQILDLTRWSLRFFFLNLLLLFKIRVPPYYRFLSLSINYSIISSDIIKFDEIRLSNFFLIVLL